MLKNIEKYQIKFRAINFNKTVNIRSLKASIKRCFYIILSSEYNLT